MTHLFSFVGKGRCARLIFCTHLKQFENQANFLFLPHQKKWNGNKVFVTWKKENKIGKY
jgi:hypothetical protein